MFFRKRYRALVVVGVRGGRMKAMTYRYHNDRVRLLLMAMSVVCGSAHSLFRVTSW